MSAERMRRVDEAMREVLSDVLEVYETRQVERALA